MKERVSVVRHGTANIILIAICALNGASAVFASQPPNFGNYQDEIQCAPSRIERPRSEEEVQEVVRRAISQGLTVKASTPKFAASNRGSCVDTGGIQLDTSGLKAILSVDRNQHLITIQPGIKLWDLNQILHKDYGLTLPAVQEYAEVTLGGMIANSTHGSSLRVSSSSVHDRLVEVRLVDGLGDVRVIRGDDLDFIGANLGVLGILTSVTLRAEPTFKVRGQAYLADDAHFEDEILALAGSKYSVSVTWFPRQKSYTVTSFDKVSNDTPGEAHNGQVEASWWKRQIFPVMFKLAHIEPGDQITCFVETQRMQMKAHGYIHEQFAHRSSNPVGWSHEMINFICRDRCPFQQLSTTLEEVAIPLEQLPRLISRIRELLLNSPTCLPLNGIYMRFGRAARGAIAMAQGRDTAYVGVELVEKLFGNRYERDFEIIQEIEQIMIHEFEGRPHWGKNSDSIFAGVKDRYPRFEEFLAFRQGLDPNRTFENQFFRFLSDGSSEGMLADDCVAKEACYCREDRHCPRGYFCGPGLISLEARVCHKKPSSSFWRKIRRTR